jgi:acyl carrier protein
MRNVLSRDEFIDAVASALSLPKVELSSMTFEEMGLDSIQLYELDLFVESLGVLLPEDALASMERIDETYEAYAVELALSVTRADD